MMMMRRGRTVEAELLALAKSAAAALVGLMVSDTWEEVKNRVARFFCRGGTTNAVLELETSRARLAAADANGDNVTAAAVEADLRAWLLHLLSADATAADELHRLISPTIRESATVYNINSGSVRHGSVIQARYISGISLG
jgi:hypothetical protein